MQADLKCHFGGYIDDCFVFGKDKRKAMLTYHRVCGNLREWDYPPPPPKLSTSKRPHKNKEVKILGMAFRVQQRGVA